MVMMRRGEVIIGTDGRMEQMDEEEQEEQMDER